MNAKAKKRRSEVIALLQSYAQPKDIAKQLKISESLVQSDIKWFQGKKRRIPRCGGQLLKMINK